MSTKLGGGKDLARMSSEETGASTINETDSDRLHRLRRGLSRQRRTTTRRITHQKEDDSSSSSTQLNESSDNEDHDKINGAARKTFKHHPTIASSNSSHMNQTKTFQTEPSKHFDYDQSRKRKQIQYPDEREKNPSFLRHKDPLVAKVNRMSNPNASNQNNIKHKAPTSTENDHIGTSAHRPMHMTAMSSFTIGERIPRRKRGTGAEGWQTLEKIDQRDNFSHSPLLSSWKHPDQTQTQAQAPPIEETTFLSSDARNDEFISSQTSHKHHSQKKPSEMKPFDKQQKSKMQVTSDMSRASESMLRISQDHIETLELGYTPKTYHSHLIYVDASVCAQAFLNSAPTISSSPSHDTDRELRDHTQIISSANALLQSRQITVFPFLINHRSQEQGGLYVGGKVVIPHSILFHLTARIQLKTLEIAKEFDWWMYPPAHSPVSQHLYNMLARRMHPRELERIITERDNDVIKIGTQTTEHALAGNNLLRGRVFRHVTQESHDDTQFTPSSKHVVYRPASCDDNFETLHVNEQGESLFLRIKQVEISNHPLSSHEQVLASQLVTNCDRYKLLDAPSRVPLLHEKLSALSTELIRMLDYQGPVGENIGLANLLACTRNLSRMERQKIHALNQEIIAREIERDSVLRELGSCLTKIIDVWRSIKTLRNEQMFISSPLSLKFRRIKNNGKDDLKLMNHCIQRAAFHSVVDHLLEGIGDHANEPDHAVLEHQIMKWYNEALVFCRERIQRSWALPGQDTIIPILSATASITPDDECPAYEIKRRQWIAQLHGHMTVFCLNKKVDDIPIRGVQASPMFAEINHNLSMRIAAGRLYNVRIALYLAASPRGRQIYLGTSELSSTSSGLTPSYGTPFTLTTIIESHHLSHPGVVIGGIMKEPTFCSTRVTYSLITSSVRPTVNMRNALCDPNDPRSSEAHIVSLNSVKTNAGSFSGSSQLFYQNQQLQRPTSTFFRLYQTHEDVLDLLPASASATSGKLTPSKKSSSPFSDLELLSSSYHQTASDPLLDRVNELADINAAHQLQLIQQMQALRRKRLTQLKDRPQFSDVVSEEGLPSIGGFGNILLQFFTQRRPLRPQRKRQRAPAQLQPDVMRVLVRVGRVTGLPLESRIATSSSVPDSRNVREQGQFHRRRPHFSKTTTSSAATAPLFSASVTLQGITQSSRAKPGPYPSFNEDFVFEYTAQRYKRQCRSSKSQTIDRDCDELIISVFQQPCDVNGPPQLVAFQSISVSVLLQNSRLQGSLPLHVPPILHRDDKFSSELINHHLAIMNEGESFQHISCRCDTFIGVDPPVRLPDCSSSKEFLQEDVSQVAFAENTIESLKKKLSGDRQYEALRPSLTGYMVFLNRFVHPQAFIFPEWMEPLSGLDVYSKQVACARFVAAIPEVNIAAEISGNLIDKAWCTPEQILSLGGSTTHERAILLCSLFLGLREEIQAYVLLGKSLTDGVSPLVLSDFVYESTFKQLLWCPTTGKCFPTSDPSLQHTGIGTAFDSEHIWLNQQDFHDPNRMTFDFTSSKSWLQIPVGKAAEEDERVQIRSPLSLPIPSSEHVRRLEEAMEQFVIRSVESWRPGKITRWDMHVSRVLHGVLTDLERLVAAIHNSPQMKDMSDLQELHDVFSIRGVAVSMPLLPVTRTLEMLKNSRIWSSNDPDQQFAFALKVFPYPGNIFLLWMYFAAIKAK